MSTFREIMVAAEPTNFIPITGGLLPVAPIAPTLDPPTVTKVALEPIGPAFTLASKPTLSVFNFNSENLITSSKNLTPSTFNDPTTPEQIISSALEFQTAIDNEGIGDDQTLAEYTKRMDQASNENLVLQWTRDIENAWLKAGLTFAAGDAREIAIRRLKASPLIKGDGSLLPDNLETRTLLTDVQAGVGFFVSDLTEAAAKLANTIIDTAEGVGKSVAAFTFPSFDKVAFVGLAGLGLVAFIVFKVF